jgi:hypothetical protein
MGKVDDPTAAPNFPTLAQRFNKRLGGARRHSMVRLKAQPKFLGFRQFHLEHQRYAIGNSGALKSGAESTDRAWWPKGHRRLTTFRAIRQK